MKTIALPMEATGQKVVRLPSNPRLGRFPKTPTGHTSRQRFRVVRFQNASGTISWRVQGMMADKKTYVRENFANHAHAETRRVELENEYLRGVGNRIELARPTTLTMEQLRICEVALGKLERAEAPDDSLIAAVDLWLKGGRKQPKECPRLDEAIDKFLAAQEAPASGIRPRTFTTRSYTLRMFGNAVPNMRVDAVDRDTIKEFLSRRKVSEVTRSSNRRILSRFFGWCAEEDQGWITYNPVAGIKGIQSSGEPPAVLPVEDIVQLMRAAEAERDGALVPYLALCAFAGLRPTEAESVDWENINLADGQMVLPAAITKTGKRRVVQISDQLGAWLRAHQDKPFRPSGMRQIFEAVREKAGYSGRVEREGLKKWVPDVLRHSYISALLRKSKSYIEVAQQCGNSEKIIREHYEARVSTEYADRFFGIGPRGG